MKFLGIAAAVLIALGIWHEASVFSTKGSPPVSCQLLGGQWNIFTGWHCGATEDTAPAAAPVAAPAAAPSPAATQAAQAEASAPSSPSPSLTDASAVVAQFYADITDGDYQDAWNLGGDNIGGTTYDQWVAGYGTTASISLGTVSDFGPGQVQAEIIATQDDGTVKTYEGTYTVENGAITSADFTQTS